MSSLLNRCVAGSIALAIVLAFFFDYGLAIRPLIAAGVAACEAARMTFAPAL